MLMSPLPEDSCSRLYSVYLHHFIAKLLQRVPPLPTISSLYSSLTYSSYFYSSSYMFIERLLCARYFASCWMFMVSESDMVTELKN